MAANSLTNHSSVKLDFKKTIQNSKCGLSMHFVWSGVMIPTMRKI